MPALSSDSSMTHQRDQEVSNLLPFPDSLSIIIFPKIIFLFFTVILGEGVETINPPQAKSINRVNKNKAIFMFWTCIISWIKIYSLYLDQVHDMMY